MNYELRTVFELSLVICQKWLILTYPICVLRPCRGDPSLVISRVCLYYNAELAES